MLLDACTFSCQLEEAASTWKLPTCVLAKSPRVEWLREWILEANFLDLIPGP